MNCKLIKCKAVFMFSVVILSKGMGFGDMISSFFSIFWFLITFSMSINCFRFSFDYAKENRVFILFSLFGWIRTTWRSLFPNCFVTMNNSNEKYSPFKQMKPFLLFFLLSISQAESSDTMTDVKQPKNETNAANALTENKTDSGYVFLHCTAYFSFWFEWIQTTQHDA
jgi:hypothetical protein